jgi:hypothetical protein
MHFNGVIALRQRINLALIWCNSMQFDETQAMMTYSQFTIVWKEGEAVNSFNLTRPTHSRCKSTRRHLSFHNKTTEQTVVYSL